MPRYCLGLNLYPYHTCFEMESQFTLSYQKDHSVLLHLRTYQEYYISILARQKSILNAGEFLRCVIFSLCLPSNYLAMSKIHLNTYMLMLQFKILSLTLEAKGVEIKQVAKERKYHGMA